MYKLQKKEDGYWLEINLPQHKQSGAFRLNTNLHDERAENLGFLKGILDTAIEEQFKHPDPEAERAYRNIRDTFYFMHNPADARHRYDAKYERALIDLDTLAQAAGIKIDGGKEDG